MSGINYNVTIPSTGQGGEGIAPKFALTHRMYAAGSTLYFDTELVSVEEGPEVLHINGDSLTDLSEF